MTTVESRIEDWSSDVFSSYLILRGIEPGLAIIGQVLHPLFEQIPQLRDDRLLATVALTIEHRPAIMRRVVLPGRQAAIAPPRLARRLGIDLVQIGKHRVDRSEERRVGKGCGSTFKSRWSP